MKKIVRMVAMCKGGGGSAVPVEDGGLWSSVDDIGAWGMTILDAGNAFYIANYHEDQLVRPFEPDSVSLNLFEVSYN